MPPPTINWKIGAQNWAYKNLAGHLIDVIRGFLHKTNGQDANINILMAHDQLHHERVDSKTILHLDGHRWHQGEGMGRTVVSLEFEHNNWSWGLHSKSVLSHLKKDFIIISIDSLVWKKNRKDRLYGDLLLSQNATQFEYLKEADLGRVISRLGGNRTFDGDSKSVNFYLSQMSKCYGVVATNQKLCHLAQAVNKNAWLIPNGIDLSKWSPLPGKKINLTAPVVGFCGNVLTVKKSEYKGYPLVKAACEYLKLPLVEALYKRGQIPHSQMREKFWNKIDVLVHPTMGEGCSNTIMEALSCGVPVITTQSAGYHGENMIHGENVLFCERSELSIIQQINTFRLRHGLAKQMSTMGRKFAEEHHDSVKIAEKYKAIFNDCLRHNEKV